MKFAASRRERAPIAYEPTLDETLADPLVLLILRRDGLAVDDVRAFLEQTRRRLRSPIRISIFGRSLRFPTPGWVRTGHPVRTLLRGLAPPANVGGQSPRSLKPG